ncbi:PREDICTED: peroxisomal biogenesis factor 3 [Cyphomyrmex costatus]|uniref:Peroxisomal biogenesis factor 3 n=1 Tax=Cyphomyrmex costatus TaxID=456900 RepID=A0A151I7Y7_9HYME|nr:PREDICTED: peroxisomal biogenesis factor 3 [Cyphomyrmex costatus]KYM94200.1 Peroxisomal biogenesis factor 3 [Cyphomyrmex costatus]
MFSSIRGFLSRHRRKFIFGSVVISSVIFLMRYTQRKLREWQENEIRMLMERTKKRQYYETTERSCDQLISRLVVTLRNSVIKENDTEVIVNQLKDGSADKIALWDQLKVLAITRPAVIIYSYTMLVTFLRIQLNLISGHMYKDTQNMSNVDNEIINSEVHERYMALSRYFIYEGIKDLSDFVQNKVSEVAASLSLTKQLTLRDLEQIYWAITSSVSADSSKDPVKNFTYYTLQYDIENGETSVYSKLRDQMLDVSESEEVQDLMQKNIRSGFVLLMDHISVYFSEPSQTNSVQNTASFSGEGSNAGNSILTKRETTNDLSEFVDVNKTTMALAKIIPIVNRQVPNNPTLNDLAEDWLQRLIFNNDLKTLGANLYEAVC